MAKFNYGIITALITPFKNGKIDFPSLERLVKFQLAAGVEGFVVNGTTAESPTLTWEEVESLFTFIRDLAPQNYPLILGVGSNSTAQTIDNAKKAEQLGAQAILVVVPYYNKPPQRGLVQHFKAVANAFSGDVIVYNVPGRTITGLTPLSISEVAGGNIVGIKEASGNLQFDKEAMALAKDLIFLSGDDGTFAEFMRAGGQGIISVASHIIPAAFISCRDAKGSNDSILKNKDLIDSLYIEANPIPVKAALKLMGIIDSAEMRLPLVELEAALYPKLELELKKANLI